jgi:transcriptional regulator with XRE-family HTH domain
LHLTLQDRRFTVKMHSRTCPRCRTPALALRITNMATTLASVEAREVLRCEHCSLVQFRTLNSICRRCRKSLEMDEPELTVPQFMPSPAEPVESESGLQVARAVRDARRMKNLSQRQLAGRMQVPRTYISKIENAKAMPTLSSLERLATALEVNICSLLHDARSKQREELAAIFADPFLAEIASCVAQLDGLQRSMFLNQVRDMAQGRRRTA